MLLEELELYGFVNNFIFYVKGLCGVGYVVGIDVVELLNLSFDSDFEFEVGMMFVVKFDLYDLIGGGYWIEVVVVVIEDGVYLLNKLVFFELDDFVV